MNLEAKDVHMTKPKKKKIDYAAMKKKPLIILDMKKDLAKLKEISITGTPETLRALAAMMIEAAWAIETNEGHWDHIHLQDRVELDKGHDIVVYHAKQPR